MTRDDLLLKIENTADFRSRKAEEYPDDPRNAKAAAELRELKGYISRLADDHPLIVAIGKVSDFDDDDVFESVEREDALLQSIGFDGPAGPEGIVRDLARCYYATRGPKLSDLLPKPENTQAARELRAKGDQHYNSRREAELAQSQFDAILNIVEEAREGRPDHLGNAVDRLGYAVDRIADLAEAGQLLTCEAGKRHEQAYHAAMDEAVDLEGRGSPTEAGHLTTKATTYGAFVEPEKSLFAIQPGVPATRALDRAWDFVVMAQNLAKPLNGGLGDEAEAMNTIHAMDHLLADAAALIESVHGAMSNENEHPEVS